MGSSKRMLHAVNYIYYEPFLLIAMAYYDVIVSYSSNKHETSDATGRYNAMPLLQCNNSDSHPGAGPDLPTLLP